MRRRRSSKPLIPFIPKYKKMVDRASQIYSLIKTSTSEEFTARLKAELVILTGNLKLPDVITEAQIYTYNDAFNKQTIPNIKVFVKMVGGLCLATLDGLTCEIMDFENDYPFTDTQVGCIYITPDARNSEVYFRDTFYRIYEKNISQDATMNSFFNGIKDEDIAEGNGIIGVG